MYVDKTLSGIKAVQTLSRLNRAHPKKHDVFVLDFMNDVETPSQAAFADFYRTTILSEETDPNKLHDLKSALDGTRSTPRTGRRARAALPGRRRPRPARPHPRRLRGPHTSTTSTRTARSTSRARPRPSCAPTPSCQRSCLHQRRVGEALDLPELPVPKLPAPKRRTCPRASSSPSTWTATGSRSRRHEDPWPTKTPRSTRSPTSGGGRKPEPELDRLSNILKTFNDQFGNIPWTDADRVAGSSPRRSPSQGRRGQGLPERACRTPTSRTRGSSTTRRSRA
jgi:type I restriction enzyme R subunit